MRTRFNLCCSFLLLFVFSLLSCSEQQSGTRILERNILLYVGSRTPDEVTWFSEDSQPTYFIKNNTSEAWEMTSYPIVGLDYEQGYEYYIEATLFHEHTPKGLQDYKEYYYRVERLISKEKKDSQIPLVNRPEGMHNITPIRSIAIANSEDIHVLLTEDLDTIYLWGADYLLSKEQVEILQTPLRAAIDQRFVHYWPYRKIYYIFEDNFIYKTEARNAMDEWERNTGVRFIEGKGNGSFIKITHGSGASSHIGMIGGEQLLIIEKNFSPNIVGTFRHELGHAIGLCHEQSRPDRDKYINVNISNLRDRNNINFQKFDKNYWSSGTFDFNSVMLYSSYYEGSINRNIPILTKKDGNTFASNRSYLSKGDIETVSAVYGPPYHTIHYDLTNESYSNPQTGDIREYYVVSVRFWEDEECTIPAKLKHPRTLYLNHSHQEADHIGSIHSSNSRSTVTIPAGVSFYILGETSTEQDMDGANIRWYRSDDITVLNSHF